MKLINHIVILSIIISTSGQKFLQDQYPFPPQFETPSTPMLSSDNTIYLPPESSTSATYFNANNIKKLPVHFLPPTAIKAPHVYPTPYSAIFSSSHRPDFDNDKINNNNNINIRRIAIPLPQNNKNANITERNTNALNADMRESRTIQAIPNYQQRFDNNEKFLTQKLPQNSVGIPPPPPLRVINQNPASRRMILTSEIQRNDNGIDQVKSASFPNSQYLQAPGIFISSTVEPAIPILRLSNEMDLDGSFSYEALGADQTHYVQHSRMENMGTDKEEQVVEGSYSYVGDNGQTYTVHYIADSNGYRASGDHLPVPPPIPEIIQRAVQYNLAEEAKRPPHLRQNWESEGSDYEVDNTDHRYTISPLRNLFTGRTPEAFSLGLAQNAQGPLISLASSQSSLRTLYDTAKDQNKTMTNIASIAPQITFLASQGAHSPSVQPQQIISRIISTEKSTLPQIMNYEANAKETEQEANKALWRWQYGVNSNENNQNTNKNSISRSFGEDDDIIINFSKMTPEQYTRMMETQISDQNTAESSNFAENSKSHISHDTNEHYYKGTMNPENVNNIVKDDNSIMSQGYEQPIKNETHVYLTSDMESILPLSTENPNLLKTSQKYENKHYQNTHENNYNNIINIHSNKVNNQKFAPEPQTITQKYVFEEDIAYEPSKLNLINENDILKKKVVTENYQTEANNFWFENYNNSFNDTHKSTINDFDNTFITDFNQNENEKNEFKPVNVSTFKYDDHISSTVGTANESMQDVIQDNIFLKHLFMHQNDETANNKANKEENQTNKAKEHILTYTESKRDKLPKPIQAPQNIQNEAKFSKKKPLDISDVINFVVMKNQFESAKMKPKSRPIEFSQEYSQKDPIRYIPASDIADEVEINHKSQNIDSPRSKDHHRNQDSVVKNYKTLHRHKHTGLNSDHQFVQESYRNVKTFPILSLPPLGRAGPSLKTYLPPTYRV